MSYRTFYLAWHIDHVGEALRWWVRNLSNPQLLHDMWRRHRHLALAIGARHGF
jgi:hypothetical protein